MIYAAQRGDPKIMMSRRGVIQAAAAVVALGSMDVYAAPGDDVMSHCAELIDKSKTPPTISDKGLYTIMAVWLLVTTNANLVSRIVSSPAETQSMAQQLGISSECFKALLSLAMTGTGVGAQLDPNFAAICNKFYNLVHGGTYRYPKPGCPVPNDLVAIANLKK
jgi:hypothetical protein